MEMNIAELELARYNQCRQGVDKLKKAMSEKRRINDKGGTFFSAALHLMKNAKAEAKRLGASIQRSSHDESSDINIGLRGSRHKILFNSSKMAAASQTLYEQNHSYDDSDSDDLELGRIFAEDQSCHLNELNGNVMEDSKCMRSTECNVSSSKYSLPASGSSESQPERFISLNDCGPRLNGNSSKIPEKLSFSSKQSLDMSLQSADHAPGECSDWGSRHGSVSTKSSKSNIKKRLGKSIRQLAKKFSQQKL